MINRQTLFVKIWAFLWMVVFCAISLPNTSGQEVTATYDKAKHSITVENNTGKEIILFHTDDPALVKIKDNQIGYANLTIADNSNIGKEIRKCGLEFDAVPGNATHISKNTRTKEITQIKKTQDYLTCYVVEGQKISKMIIAPVKFQGTENSQPTPSEPTNPTTSNTVKPESPKSPKQSEPKKQETPKEVKKIVINPFTDRIAALINQCNSLLQKGTLSDRDRENLKDLRNKLNDQTLNIEEYLKDLWDRKRDTHVKCEDCDILILSSEKMLTNIDNVKRRIVNALKRVDDSVVLNWKKEYRGTVLPAESVMEDDFEILGGIKAEIEERLQHSTTGWIGKEAIKSQLDKIKKRYDQINTSSKNFIAQKQKQYPDENDRAAIADLANEIPVEYKDIQYCYERLAEIQIPYLMLSVTGVLLLLFIFGILFYVITILKNKRLEKKEKQKRQSDMGGLLIEDDDDFIEIKSYKTGLGNIREKAGTDYFEVNMLSMLNDTGIRSVYFSRKAILDIYKFFSGFLKYDDKTNETGCFLVGRWDYVPNSGNQMYDISIEELVEPGDDAVYGEYNLNFGAKIGITLTYALENLCQKTGNEYVHTAWMHSHPGLGLFLSSQDLNVQSQLAHSQHQARLLAIVIDSNSPDFEMAFFTPKQNGSMNNDKDLKQTLALETLYQWAKSLPGPQQEKAPAATNVSYFSLDILNKTNNIGKVNFSGSAIIDMDTIIMPGIFGLQGYFYGACQGNEITIDDCKEVTAKENNPIGGFLTVPQFSVPETVNEYRQVISGFSFSIFYSFENRNLYILIKDEQGNYPATLDKITFIFAMTLKEWTRRKR
ncbi:MAG: hypothetical protein FWF65_01515 [Bacteroidetes bacterium]|nr:hypothetical protein [Bacteroidota bacterium]